VAEVSAGASMICSVMVAMRALSTEMRPTPSSQVGVAAADVMGGTLAFRIEVLEQVGMRA
jgi:hypothetical protein